MGRPRKRPRLGQHPTPPPPPPLPFDLVQEIAGRTDPETLVRCAAACKDLRRRIAATGFRRHHLFRHGNRFVRGLLRGHLVQDKDEVKCFPANASPPADVVVKPFPTLHGHLVAARDGLLLLARRGITDHTDAEELSVYSSATGRHQKLPLGPDPEYYTWCPGDYVLLAGDGDGTVGRSFRVLNVQVTMLRYRHQHYMTLDTFSSEHGVWTRNKIVSPATLRHSSAPMRLLGKPLVFRDAVHWLGSRDNEYRVVTLHLGATAARLTSSPELPESFPGRHCQPDQFLLATTAAAGRRSRALAVLVAEATKIQAWSRSERTGEWKKRPQLVIRNSAIDTGRRVQGNVQLKWFGERSGVVLIRVLDHGDFWWLDLRTKEVIKSSGSTTNIEGCFPYEIDLSDWAPTFDTTF